MSVDQIVPARPKREFPAAPVDESMIDCTIRLLQSLIATPKLTEKHLQKPPFRLLHDIVCSLIRDVGFPDNYFDPSELHIKNLSEIAPKLEFLEKLLDLVSIVNAVDLAFINPKKIVAGLEFENTNRMLQELAKAAASGISVQQIQALLEAQEAAGIAGDPAAIAAAVAAQQVAAGAAPNAELSSASPGAQ